MAASDKSVAMVSALKSHYQRLVELGAERMAPATMADFRERIGHMESALSSPYVEGGIGPDVGILAGYKVLRPEMDKLEGRIREKEVKLKDSVAESAAPPKWLPWVAIGGAALLGYFVMTGVDRSQNPKRRRS